MTKNDEQSPHVVGVGPWVGPHPTDDHYDPELLAEGDARNVIDKYRYWKLDAIIADLDTTRTGLHLAVENTGHDFNLGSVVRTANAFNVSRVHIVGRRRWNRRGAMVTDRYLHIDHHKTTDDFRDWAHNAGTSIVGVDNHPGATDLPATQLPANAALILGEEGPGVSQDLWQSCDIRVQIPQLGSTRSINLGAAAAIVMYEWHRQHHAAYQPHH